MRRLLLKILSLGLLFSSCKEDRVAKAYAEKLDGLKAAFESKNLRFPAPILIQVYKNEKELDVLVMDMLGYKLFKTYEICKISGNLGRKLKEGDKQVPEGFYHIEKFNPQSDYHLSLGINYPNEADKFVADSLHPGSDIYIHGDCVSVGCMAMTDDQIKEIYILALEDKMWIGMDVNVNIYPFRMTDTNMYEFSKRYPQWQSFWQSLKVGYDYVKREHLFPKPEIKNGEYFFKVK